MMWRKLFIHLPAGIMAGQYADYYLSCIDRQSVLYRCTQVVSSKRIMQNPLFLSL